MAFYVNNPPRQVIDNQGNFEIAVYSTRADLPSTGLQGYMAYVQDQEELVINTGNTVYPNPNNTQPVPIVNNVIAGTVSANYLVVAGGGGATTTNGGGGGGGGVLTGTTTLSKSSAYTINVGAGGSCGQNGNPSSISSTGFTTITALGGGAGGAIFGTANAGGSGGGGGMSRAGGAGTPGQGNPGGAGNIISLQAYGAGGGGGAGSAGGNAVCFQAGAGGSGRSNSISGVATFYGGGGGGGWAESGARQGCGSAGQGGSGGGGAGGLSSCLQSNICSSNGTTNTGGGAGGGSSAGASGGTGRSGGSGVAVIAYCGTQIFNGGTVTSSGGKTIHTFNSSGVLFTNQASTSPDLDVTWYKLLPPEGGAAQSGRLDQGTMQGGYNAIVQWNYIHQLVFSTDSAILRPETTPWASRYSTAMSSNLFAYYHAGNTGPTPDVDTGEEGQTCRQSWTTYAVSRIASVRGNMLGSQQVTLYSTSNLNNNYGIMQFGGASAYFIFATDTTATDSWFTNGSGPFSGTQFNDPNGGNNYGLSANGPVNGYVNWTNVSKFNWSSRQFTTTGQGAPNARGGQRGGHSTPYNKFYYGYYANIDIYNTTVDLWNVSGGTQCPLFTDDSRFSDAGGARSIFLEATTVPGQDWGYVYSMFDYESGYQTPPAFTSNGPYTNISQKMFYATDTEVWSPTSDLGFSASFGGVISGNSASGCSGPSS